MLDTELDGAIGFSIVGPSEDAYAGSAVAGIGVRQLQHRHTRLCGSLVFVAGRCRLLRSSGSRKRVVLAFRTSHAKNAIEWPTQERLKFMPLMRPRDITP